MQSTTIEAAGESIRLFANHTAYLPRLKILLVADIHLGKSESRRSQGLYMPQGPDANDLEHLIEICEKLEAAHIVVLGDLFHDSFALNAESTAAFESWCSRLKTGLTLVLGNHDKKGLFAIQKLPLQIKSNPFKIGPLLLSHEPAESDAAYNICGHLHPGFSFKDRAGCNHRCKAFWRGNTRLVLPAFGTTTSLANVATKPGDTLYLCADEDLVKFKPK